MVIFFRSNFLQLYELLFACFFGGGGPDGRTLEQILFKLIYFVTCESGL